jgi:hypothetical protein
MSDILSMAKAAIETDLVGELEPEELVDILSQTDIPPKDINKLAGTIVYIRKRFIEGLSRVESFKIAFPSRSIPSGETNVPFQATGSELSKTTIDIKAKRLENSSMYKKIVTLLQTSLYVSFAMQRIQVLDDILERLPESSDRDFAALSKVFLDETRKPEGAKGMEVNVNVQNNDVNLVTVEKKLEAIADKMVGHTAEYVIEALDGNSTTSSV